MEKNTTIFGGDDYDLGNNVQIDDLESERQKVFAFYIDKSSSMRPHEAVMPDCIDIVKKAIINSKSEDEFFVGYDAAANGVLLENHSQYEPLVLLKHYPAPEAQS